jgi:hypothetical protein
MNTNNDITLKEYYRKYIKPKAMENITKAMLLPYQSYEYLRDAYGEEIALKLKKLLIK